MKNIFIICVSNDTRGAKVVFLNFLDRLKSRKSDETKYYIFTSWKDIESVDLENIKFVYTKKTGLLSFFDHERSFYKKWSVENKVFADLIVSMQNVTINYFKNVRQIVLFQQSIPLSDEKWNPLFKSERNLFFYKKIYPYFIKRYVTDSTIFVAPTNWVRDKLIEKFKLSPKNVLTIYSEINYNHTTRTNDPTLQNNHIFFYPANDSKHKNHRVLIEAMKYLKDNSKLTLNIKIILTVPNDSRHYIFKLIKKNGLLENFELVDKLSIENVENYYRISNALLFPSTIESFGLPLIEAANFGLPILAADLPYSREVIGKYEGARFISPNDPSEWANAIIRYSSIFRYQQIQIKFNSGLNDFIDLITSHNV